MSMSNPGSAQWEANAPSTFHKQNTSYHSLSQSLEADNVGLVQRSTPKPSKNHWVNPKKLRNPFSSLLATLSSIFSFPEAWNRKQGLDGENLMRHYQPSHQFRNILLSGFTGWCITILLCAGLFGVLYGYSSKSALTSIDKHAFNVLQNFFVLTIFMSVGAATGTYSKIVSWRLLAARYRSLGDFDLVMNCDSKTNVFTLLWRGRDPGQWRPSRTQTVCFISLVVTIGLEMASIFLGLTFEVDTATTHYDHAYGQVSVVQLDTIWDTHSLPTPLLNPQRGIANIYGLMGQNYEVSYESPASRQAVDEIIFTIDNRTFYHRFRDENTNEIPVIAEFSDRIVNTTATCQELSIIEGGYIDQRTLIWIDENGTRQSLYVSGMAIGTTTYMSSNETTCGPRCSRILVLNTGDRSIPTQPAQLFSCNSTVGEVVITSTLTLDNTNQHEPARQQEYQIPDIQAQIIAGSIGWSGNYNISTPWQFQTYTHNSYWSWDNIPQTAAQIQINIMYFAADTIAAMDDSGPRKIVQGYYPRIAEVVEVDWHYAIIILVLVPLVQGLLLVGVAVFSRGVIVRDPGCLATARLLKPVVDRMDSGRGSTLSGDEIVDALGDVRVVYGVTASPSASPGQSMNAGLILQDNSSSSPGFVKPRVKPWFPAGKYD